MQALLGHTEAGAATAILALAAQAASWLELPACPHLETPTPMALRPEGQQAHLVVLQRGVQVVSPAVPGHLQPQLLRQLLHLYCRPPVSLQSGAIGMGVWPTCWAPAPVRVSPDWPLTSCRTPKATSRHNLWARRIDRRLLAAFHAAALPEGLQGLFDPAELDHDSRCAGCT